VFSAAESDALHARVRAFIAASLHGESVTVGGTPTPPGEAFDGLALDLARFQARHIPALARLARARGVDLGGARDASAIPAVPCDVFRLSRIAVHPPSCDVAIFRTSGTSGGVAARGEHPLRTTETYEQAALGWAPRFLWPDGANLAAWVLAPSLAEQPDSSLGFMLDRFAHGFETRPCFLVHLREDGHAAIDLEGIGRAAGRAREAGRPVIVLATSFALVHLLEQSEGLDLRLPPGSRVMQTGGFKGRSREIAPDELCRRVGEAFGVPDDHVVGEYGMTELGSQLYEGTLAAALGTGPTARHGVYFAPPWVRVDAVNPVSLEPLPPGEVGIARIVDLANVDSAVAIQTADRVRVGDGGVELFGRLPGAAPRGCSLAVDEMLGGG
jgi:hypothetical protein